MPSTRGRDLLLLLFAVPAFVGFAVLSTADVGWFPQQYAAEFYVVKGAAALLAVVLLLLHMSTTWPRIGTTSQRLRYLTLFAAIEVITGASVAQYHDGVPVTGRNIGGFFVAVLTIIAAVASLLQDRRHQ